MKLGRAIVLLAAAVYLLFGLRFVASPVASALNFDTQLLTPTALSNFRSAQGGQQLGLGLFLFACGIRREWVDCGLWAVALTSGGFVAGRLTSLALDGRPKTLTFVLLALEAIGTAAPLVALWRARGLRAADADGIGGAG